jgi:hypothetical protein
MPYPLALQPSELNHAYLVHDVWLWPALAGGVADTPFPEAAPASGQLYVPPMVR